MDKDQGLGSAEDKKIGGGDKKNREKRQNWAKNRPFCIILGQILSVNPNHDPLPNLTLFLSINPIRPLGRLPIQHTFEGFLPCRAQK